MPLTGQRQPTAFSAAGAWLRSSSLLVCLLLAAGGCGGRDEAKWPDASSGVQSSKPSDGAVEGDRDGNSGAGGTGSDEPDAATSQAGRKSTTSCTPPKSSERLRPRSYVMAGGDGVFTRDLFELFRSNCGGCHVDQSQGEWHVKAEPTWEDFAKKVDDAISAIETDDEAEFMPPPPFGIPWSERTGKGASDPIVELDMLLNAWRDAGAPPDVFYPEVAESEDGAVASPFVMDRAVGMSMTNMGSCVPRKGLVGIAPSSEMDELDDMFANFKTSSDLPDKLEQTDVDTLDSAELAKKGVLAFSPAYTLWADNAKKFRAIRLPRGKKIEFDVEKQSFAIPTNTRFYKTFLKKVTDEDGNESYRKMETRIIVSRPDIVNPDGSHKFQALFGTYAWNNEETEATLVRDPLRNGEPFRDRLVTYVVDEKKAFEVITSTPKNLAKTLEENGLTRTYAIPGSERCIQCHMGAPNGSFILGFTPLQLRRQPMGVHGVIEPALSDELNQLQRFIEYGIISGMTSPRDVKLLEETQGKRKPRNDHELAAQGYMLGNCAHCHNPIGFPTVAAPELRELLNFQPSENGGIFEFPLDRFSPRVRRGASQQFGIPYITPSLFDLNAATTANKKVGLTKATGESFYLLAPWRSLIYRNVDAPFSYVEDFAIFPHMPRHTPGYDCRARQLLGTWMTSIPAHAEELGKARVFDADTEQNQEAAATSDKEQPYTEVKPGEEAFKQAETEAKKRVEAFKKAYRYNDCPAPDLDIVVPEIRDNPGDSASTAPKRQFVGAEEDVEVLYPQGGSLPPERAHWFVTDLTEPTGDWSPRRADWEEIMKNRDPAKLRPGEADTLGLLDSMWVSINPKLREYALTDAPMGIWREDSKKCQFPASIKTVMDIPLEARPSWMRGIPEEMPTPETAHVYSISPGAHVFALICRNCHGVEADSKSRLAETIADLTGGSTRVANLRDGLFGPKPPNGEPGQNIARIFEPVSKLTPFAADDWAAHYTAWMALGGTQRVIPPEIISLISISHVLGAKRTGSRPPEAGSANMLSTAQFLCGDVLPVEQWNFDLGRATLITAELKAKVGSALVFTNGDGHMWQQMCTFQNPLPVRAVSLAPDNENGKTGYKLVVARRTYDRGFPTEWNVSDLFKRESYGTGPVGDQTGSVQPTLTEANLAPWCVRPPTPDAESVKVLMEADWVAKHGAGTLPPYCPLALNLDLPNEIDRTPNPNRLDDHDMELWTKRGAMNSGLAAFIYLEALGKKEKQRVPDYDRCDELVP